MDPNDRYKERLKILEISEVMEDGIERNKLVAKAFSHRMKPAKIEFEINEFGEMEDE